MTLPIDSRTAAYWPLDEQHDSLLPSDASGHVADLAAVLGSRPPVVDGTITGFGREYVRAAAPGLGLWLTGDVLRLRRALSIIALVRLDVESLAAGNACVLVQRGHGGATDPRSFRFGLEVVNVPTRQVRARLSWQTEAGVDVLDDGALFHWPAGEYLLVAATREVIAGQLAVRYQINGESALGVQTHALDCGGKAAGWLAFGAGMASSSGATEHILDGVLDSLQILNEAVSPEEFQWLWYRLAYAMPEGVATMRQLVPPGVYTTDPESRVQRELAVEGMAIGNAKALARRLRYFSLPDAAFGESFARWETLTGYAPKPGDHLRLRRDRILSFLGTVRGYAVGDVQAQLAEPFDIETAAVQVLEYGNDYAHDFAADRGDAIVTVGNLFQWALSGGMLEADTGAAGTTNKDLRYSGVATPKGALYVWSLASGVDAWSAGKVQLTVAVGDAVAGMVLGRRDTDEWVFVGARGPGLTNNDLVWLKFKGGVLDATATVLAASWNTNPTYLRLRALANGEIEVRWGSSASAADGAAATVIAPAIGVPQWAGFCFVAPGNFSAENGQARFDDLLLRTPNGHQRFNWYAYRDPGLPGNPDMIGARELVRRIKPAHTHASACTVTAVKCDDAANGCDQAPIGL